MSKSLVLPILLFASLLFTNCQSFRTDYQSPETILEDYFQANKQIFDTSIDDIVTTNSSTGEEHIFFSSKNNCVVEINKAHLHENGVTHEGDVIIEFMEIFGKSNMVLAGVNTVGRNRDNENQLLISGGQYDIRVFSKETGNELGTSRTYTVTIPMENTGGEVNNMQLFVFEDLPFVNWVLAPIDGDYNSLVQSQDSTYVLMFTDFNFINCDAFRDYPDTLGKVSIEYPRGLNADNSFAFISIDDFDNSLANLGVGIPIGFPCHLILMAKTEEHEFHYHIEPLIIEENLHVNLSNITLSTGTEAEFLEALNALP